MDEAKLYKYSPGFLQDLAGNAYETTSCAASFLCAMIFLAENFACERRQTSACGLKALGSVSANQEEDDGDDDMLVSGFWRVRTARGLD